MGRTSDISEDILGFIARRIDSVSHLEALLLLWESPARDWTDEDVSTRIYVSRERTGIILKDLARHGLIIPNESAPTNYKYNSACDEAEIVQRVSSTYRRHLVYVANVIHSKLPSESVLQFAEAFQLWSKD